MNHSHIKSSSKTNYFQKKEEEVSLPHVIQVLVITSQNVDMTLK
jgi:hypothetical protein